MRNFDLVYEFTNRNSGFLVLLIPLLLTAAGIVCFFYYKKLGDRNSTAFPRKVNRRSGMAFGIACFAFAIFLCIKFVPSTLENYSNTKKIFNNKLYQTVEGKVENYHPMPASGHDTERFDVNGVHFQFSDFDVSDFGYNNAASHGGVIREGLYVRIGYLNNGYRNMILKLEIERP